MASTVTSSLKFIIRDDLDFSLHLEMIKYSSMDFDRTDFPLLHPVESITVAPESIDAKFLRLDKEVKSAWYFDCTSNDF